MNHRFFSWVLCLLVAIARPAGTQTPGDTLITSGKASFYADRFHGQETSSGDVFNANDFTAAHRTLPFGTIVSVTNKSNGRNVIVRINDRGPFIKSRIIDITRSAAKKLRMIPLGVVPVRIQVLDVLDQCPLHDSLLKADDILDCYGNKKELSPNAVYIWSTKDLKHAFYMASSLSLEYKLDSVFVAATGDQQNRRYRLYASHLSTKEEAGSLAEKLRDDGFKFSKPEPVKK